MFSPLARLQRLCRAHLAVLMLVSLSELAGGCSRHSTVSEAPTFFSVPDSPLLLPRLDGWHEDKSLTKLAPEEGGVVLRLLPPNSVPGAPSIQVTREAKNNVPTGLEAWLTRGLREMGQLEASGQIRILRVEQKQVQISNVPAYHVQHEFTLGQKSAAVSLFQVALFLVLDGRGVTVSAAGRTELFHPLAQSIGDVLDHLVAGPVPRSQGIGPQPIDLGRVGGP